MHNLVIPPPGAIESALVVDLDSKSLFELCRALRELGYRTFGATSFTEAKRFLVAEHPSILIADVRLGEFNGIQLLLLAKELRPGIAVVITNAFPDSILAAETRRMGGAFMVKPVDPHELLDRIAPRSRHRNMMERRQSDRRVLQIPNFFPERRVTERRKQPLFPA